MAEATTFSCPHCQGTLKTAAPLPVGKKVKCPRCQEIFAVPAASSPPVSPIRAKSGGTQLPQRKPAALPESLEKSAKATKRLVDDDTRLPSRMPRPRDEDEDLVDLEAGDEPESQKKNRGEDSDEERPRKKKKKTKKKKRSGGLGLLLGLGGAVVALLGLLAIGAFVWPKFLGGSEREISNNLMQFAPPGTELALGVNLATWRTYPDWEKHWQKAETGLRALPDFPSHLVEVLRDTDDLLMAGTLNGSQFVVAVRTGKPYDAAQVKTALKVGPEHQVDGQTFWESTEKPAGRPPGFVAFPRKDMVVIGQLPRETFAKILKEAAFQPMSAALVGRTAFLKGKAIWAVVSLEGELRTKMQPLEQMAGGPGAPPQVKQALPVVQRAKALSLWAEYQSNKMEVAVALSCASMDDADVLKSSLDQFWAQGGKEMAGMVAGGQGKDSDVLLGDFTRTFQIDKRVDNVAASIVLSEQALKSLENLGDLPFMPRAPMPKKTKLSLPKK